MPTGFRNSYVNQLRTALSALTSGDTAGACMNLQIFINHVEAQIEKKLGTPESAAFMAAARQIKTVLNCP